MTIRSRKADHIDICLKERVAPDHCYWDDVKLVHNAMPEIDMDDIDMTADVLGKKLAFPMVVTAITGGFPGAKKINSNIAEACAELGIGMGVGSERAGVRGVDPETYSVINDFDVPLVIGNIGAPQLVKQKSGEPFTDEMVKAAADLIDADYIAVHLNFLQEVIQPEGDRCGAGIDRYTAERLKGIGVRGLDIAGMGGTSFSAVEMYRASMIGDDALAEMGNTFFDWGIPAPAALAECRASRLPLIASGGILDGTHVAAAVAMGAEAAGVAHAVLREATESADAVKKKLMLFREELRAAMMLTGSANIKQLAEARHFVAGETREWIEGLKWTQKSI